MRTRAIAVGCLLVGALAGAAGAQAVEIFSRPHYLNTGLFTVGPFEGANFRVTLDDNASGPPAQVLLQFFDTQGRVVARSEETLAPGQSASLQITQPGVYRAHARILDPDVRLSARRILVGTVEIFDDKLFAKKYVCMVGGLGRIPD
jgi:hypothetical protein